MHIRKITYYEPNMSQPPSEREQLEQVGYVVHDGLHQISPILDSYDEADEWLDEQDMLNQERGD